mmetsp:Transcript_117687/g.375046  ORF Transcript_117687/g.375046 Transcript_117687/m.375046 type:complete len:906 (+) Transcript_117687:72-2789(+)
MAVADESAWADVLCHTLSAVSPGARKVPHVAASSAAVAEAVQASLSGCMPLVIAGAIDGWRARTEWTMPRLAERFGASHVRVGLRPEGRPETMLLSDFVAYVARDADKDLEPRYVFEPNVREPLTSEYDATLGGLFPDDFMSLLGESTRPPHRWLCLGPQRSGSRPHIDPLATSAWNALLVGRKRWALIDASVVDRDVPRSEADAGLPNGGSLSPAEWFSERLPALRAKCPSAVYEAVQEAGEVMVVPAGIWHAVLNLTDTVAVTHNFVGQAEFNRSWRSVAAERPGLAREWLRLLQAQEPELAKRARELGAPEGAVAEARAQSGGSTGSSKKPGEVREGVGAKLLRQRLEGKRRLEMPKRGAPSWSAIAARDFGARFVASAGFRRGQVVFAERALACVYEDEVPSGRLVEALFEQLPKTLTVSELLSMWGLGRGSTSEAVFAEMTRHCQSIWCQGDELPGISERLEGLAIFPSSGLVRHVASEPALARIFVGDCLVAVATRDIAKGEELTACLASWRFDETRHHADLRAVGAGLDEDWPNALLERDSTQAQAALRVLAEAERAAWASDGDAAHAKAAEKVRGLMAQLTMLPELRSSHYVVLRANMLVVHLCMGMHHLDDAWDAAVRVIDLLPHLPLGEASELTVQLALLGAALAYQQAQPERARELFAAAAALLGRLLCEDESVCWPLWLRTFLPPPLLPAALAAWADGGSGGSTTDAEVPLGLGTSGCGGGGGEEATNMEVWAARSQTASAVPALAAPAAPATTAPSAPAPAPQVLPVAPALVASPLAGSGGESAVGGSGDGYGWRQVATPFGEVEVSRRPDDGAVVVTLTLALGMEPQDVLISSAARAVRLARADGGGGDGATDVEVALPVAVDVEASKPARFSRKTRQLVLEFLPAAAAAK